MFLKYRRRAFRVTGRNFDNNAVIFGLMRISLFTGIHGEGKYHISSLDGLGGCEGGNLVAKPRRDPQSLTERGDSATRNFSRQFLWCSVVYT